MKSEVEIGVCISNKDPKNLGRIRVIPINFLGRFVNLRQILSFVNSEDELAIQSLRYKPWFVTSDGNFKERDPFVCEPFLPKMIGITPNPGQLVKIIKYDDLTQKNEFIGPYTIDQITLNEEFRNVVNNLQKNIDLNEILPKKGKNFISGYSNEQVILGDNEYLVRLNFIDSNKKRKNSYPFIQLSQFNNSISVRNETQTITETPDVYIDHICEVFINYSEKNNIKDRNFKVTVLLYKTDRVANSTGELGLTKDTYNPDFTYETENTNNFLVKHIIETSSYGDLSKIIEEIIISYNSGGVVKYYNVNLDTTTQTTVENDNTTINVINNIPNTPNIGGAVNPSNIVPGIRSWIFRLTPLTSIINYRGSLLQPNTPINDIRYIRYNDYLNLDRLITQYSEDRRYGLLAINKTTVTTVVAPVSELNDKPQSVYTTHSDKFLFLSSLNSLNIVNDFTTDGLSSTKVAEYLSGVNQNVRTYGFVRGEKLMQLLLEILEVFNTHGHEIGVDPRGSIIETSKERIEGLKKRVNDEIKQNENNIIINHNFRVN